MVLFSFLLYSDDGAPSSAVSATSEPVTKDEKELDEEYMNELAEEWASCEGQPPWRCVALHHLTKLVNIIIERCFRHPSPVSSSVEGLIITRYALTMGAFSGTLVEIKV